jgi:tetratricopeptide (TPR) repeat protein
MSYPWQKRGRSGGETMTKGIAALVVGLLAWPGAASAQHVHDPAGAEDLGAVAFQVSCDPSVVAEFDRAMALLHHMMYDESRAAFERIAERDPRCGMAHWGIAMTRVQPLWYPAAEADLRLGRESVQRAKELGVETARERALLATAEALFRDPGELAWWDRLDQWMRALRSAHQARPDDIEIAALYALSELAAGQPAEDRLAYNARAAAVLLPIHEREPRHPGAIHYTIHADDVAGRAEESLHIVRSYDAIAPSVPHALHMPTHIFVRLGDWPDVIEWNRKSADAALNFPVGDRVSLHYPHALDYLVYAHLQRGEDAEASAVLDEAAATGAIQEHFVTAFHLAIMPARYAVERRAWDEAAALEPRTPGYLNWDNHPWPEAMARFARGLGATRTGDLPTARQEERRMADLRDAAERAGLSDHARYIEIDRLVLAGWIAHADGAPDDAVARIREAAALEATIQKHPVTPGALLPPYEALGELYLELGRHADALRAFEKSLEIWPARFNSLDGAARAALAAGDRERAKHHYGRLLDVVGDTDRRGVAEARRLVAGGG